MGKVSRCPWLCHWIGGLVPVLFLIGGECIVAIATPIIVTDTVVTVSCALASFAIEAGIQWLFHPKVMDQVKKDIDAVELQDDAANDEHSQNLIRMLG